MNIDVYTFCWNEEAILPFFLRHYYARKIVVYDDGSTDRSREIAASDPRVEIREFPPRPYCDHGLMSEIKGTCWRGSDADWVVVVDVDEFLYHPDLVAELGRLKEAGVTLPAVHGYEMVGHGGLPVDDGRQLIETIRDGAPSPLYSKRCIFDPAKVTGMVYGLGAHHWQAEGEVVEGGDLKLLHMNFLGVGYIIDRWNRWRSRIAPDQDPRAKRYDWSPEMLREHHAGFVADAVTVIGGS